MIKVLWIDDTPNNDFMERAEAYNIHIENKENVDDGIAEILNSSTSYDAIILDANCISHNDGTTETSVSALSYALKRITAERITQPWFVYSGGGFSGEESIDIIVESYERPYDDCSWYRKPKQMTGLFLKIQSVVSESDVFIAKQQHPEIFKWYQNQKELIKILSYLDDTKRNDSSIFNLIRKELDWLMSYFFNCGILNIAFNKTNLSECSRALGDDLLSDNNLVPLHVQRCLHALCRICNDGSHRQKVDEIVKSGNAPYLIKSLVFDFLNVLYWAKDLPIDEIERLQLQRNVNAILGKEQPAIINDDISTYEGKIGIVHKDGNGNFYVERCRLPYKRAQEYLCKEVKLQEIVPNDAVSKDNYPFYAKKIYPTSK